VKRLYKITTVMLCTVMLAMSFAGCANKATMNQNSEVKTVHIWSLNSHSKGIMNELVSTYNSTIGKEKGINIVYEVKENNFNQTLDLAIASNQAPEIFNQTGIQQQAENGVIAAIEDMPGGSNFLEKYHDYLIKNFNTYNGKNYSVPYSITTMGLAYNKEMFKRKGIVDANGEAKPPLTYDEMRADAKLLTDTSKQEYGIAMPLKWDGFFSYDIVRTAVASVGYELFDPTKGEYNLDGLKPILNMYMGIKNDKSYFPGADGLDNDPARAQFSEGRIGMKISESWDVGVFNDQFPAKMDWGVAPLPVANADVRYKQFLDCGSVYNINKKTLDNAGADKVMNVYEWINSDEVIKELYKAGMNIPYNPDIVKDVKLDNPKHGWEDFCRLGKISASAPGGVPIDISGEKDAKAVFYEEIWAGKISIDDAIKDLNTRYNIGMKKKLHGDSTIKLDDYINKAWDSRLK